MSPTASPRAGGAKKKRKRRKPDEEKYIPILRQTGIPLVSFENDTLVTNDNINRNASRLII